MSLPPISPGDHLSYIRLALSTAERSPPKPTNYCVGAVLVDEPTNTVLSTGYTLELPGNTHAEQCALAKYAAAKAEQAEAGTKAETEIKVEAGNVEAALAGTLPPGTVIYTTMEPCSERLSGNLPCVDRILATQVDGKGGITTVYVGVQEPETFVGSNVGRSKLEARGVRYVHVPGLEAEILAVATAGHAAEADAS